jgi:hypothetical protein
VTDTVVPRLVVDVVPPTATKTVWPAVRFAVAVHPPVVVHGDVVVAVPQARTLAGLAQSLSTVSRRVVEPQVEKLCGPETAAVKR